MPCADGILGSPLQRTGRTLRQLPLVAEQVVEVAVVPLHRVGGPGAFQAAGDRVGAFAGSERVPPAETLLLEAGALGFGTAVFGRVGGTVGFAEGVAAGNQRHGLLVIHGHAAERLANVPGRGERIGFTVGPLRIHVDQAHLNGAVRFLELPVVVVTLGPEPLDLRPPVNVRFRLPDVLTPTGETERLEPHRLQGTVAGEDHQIGPREFPAVLLLDRPKQPPGLVEARIVGPAVEGREALRAGGRAAPAVGDAVRAGAVPRHPNEERPVMAVVGRPPVLRRRHHRFDVLLQGIQVEFLELLGVVELLAHGVGQGRVLVEDLQVQLIRPPVSIRPGPSRRVSLSPVHHRALGCGI